MFLRSNNDYVLCLFIGGRVLFFLCLDFFLVFRGGSEFLGWEVNMFLEVWFEFGRDDFFWNKKKEVIEKVDKVMNVSIIFKIFEFMCKIEECLVKCMKFIISIIYILIYFNLFYLFFWFL